MIDAKMKRKQRMLTISASENMLSFSPKSDPDSSEDMMGLAEGPIDQKTTGDKKGDGGGEDKGSLKEPTRQKQGTSQRTAAEVSSVG
jgi:hypothetical protein